MYEPVRCEFPEYVHSNVDGQRNASRVKSLLDRVEPAREPVS